MRQDARENRKRILDAAEVVFGGQGAAGSTEEVARLAGVGIATVFRHFSTKEELVEAALVRHLDRLAERARGFAAGAEAEAWRVLVWEMVGAGATKLALASVLGDRAEFPVGVMEASDRLKGAVGEVLRRAQGVGAVRGEVTVEEVYLLIRGISQASATMPTRMETVERAVGVVLAGMEERE